VGEKMISMIRTIYVWTAFILLLMIWCPIMVVIRLFDRDPLHYRTGRFYRSLSKPLVKLIPIWKIYFTGEKDLPLRRPYVVVSNHQSLLDIPVISYMGMEMKWVAKSELFRVPFLGWMLSLADDIALDRSSPRSGVQAMIKARKYLQGNYPVIFFPEGTRSRDGLVQAFSDGPFHLAIKQGALILPLAIEGASECIPKNSLRFGPPRDVYVHVFPVLETTGLSLKQTVELQEQVRRMIMEKIAAWRSISVDQVDGKKNVPAQENNHI
jgi:1-acyl-sn-glycerol-3-phosphate acyltransferase